MTRVMAMMRSAAFEIFKQRDIANQTRNTLIMMTTKMMMIIIMITMRRIIKKLVRKKIMMVMKNRGACV